METYDALISPRTAIMVVRSNDNHHYACVLHCEGKEMSLRDAHKLGFGNDSGRFWACDKTREELKSLLKLEVQVHNTLSCLEVRLPQRLQQEIGQKAEETLRDETLARRVAGIMYSQPLPNGDTVGWSMADRPGEYPQAEKLIRKMIAKQAFIKEVSQGMNGLDTEGSHGELLRYTATRLGIQLTLVELMDDPDADHKKILATMTEELETELTAQTQQRPFDLIVQAWFENTQELLSNAE